MMLTFVLERTAEIGIRRTAGATRLDVPVQFLAESLMVTPAGGACGILVGVGIAWGIGGFAGWRTHVSFVAVVLALLVSLLVGLVFGLYPDLRTAWLEPVDGITHE